MLINQCNYSQDFIKNANDSDFITLVNLSGQAPNALLNLEGKVVFEKANYSYFPTYA